MGTLNQFRGDLYPIGVHSAFASVGSITSQSNSQSSVQHYKANSSPLLSRDREGDTVCGAAISTDVCRVSKLNIERVTLELEVRMDTVVGIC